MHFGVQDPEQTAGGSTPDRQQLGAGVRRKQKSAGKTETGPGPGGAATDVLMGQKLTLFSLPQDVILMIVEMLDVESALAFLRTARWLHEMLSPCDSYWKMLCIKTEFANYPCLETQVSTRQLGWAGIELHNTGVADRSDQCQMTIMDDFLRHLGACE